MIETDIIHNREAIEGMRSLPDTSIDCIWTDPPYNIEYHYEGYQDSLETNEYKQLMEAFFQQASRILKPGRVCYMKQFYKNLPVIMELGCKYLNFHNLIIWKNSSPAQPNNNFKPAYEVIFMFTKGDISYFNPKFEVRKTIMPWDKKRIENYYGKLNNVWDDIPFIYGGSIKHREGVYKPGTNEKAHPCQHPIQLVVRSIGFTTQEGEIVLDPFMGSGTTAVACQQLNRRFIGFELVPAYVDLARSRLSQKVLLT